MPFPIDVKHSDAPIKLIASDILRLTKLNNDSGRLGESQSVMGGSLTRWSYATVTVRYAEEDDARTRPAQFISNLERGPRHSNMPPQDRNFSNLRCLAKKLAFPFVQFF